MKTNKPSKEQLLLVQMLLNNKLDNLKFVYTNKKELEKVFGYFTELDIISLKRELTEHIYKTIIYYQVEISTTVDNVFVFKKDTEYAIRSRGGIEFTDLKKVTGEDGSCRSKPKTIWAIFKNPNNVDRIRVWDKELLWVVALK